MRLVNGSICNNWAFFAVAMCVACSLLLPVPALAQCNTSTALKGFNALYGNCGAPVIGLQGGFTLVDATQYTSGNDICVAINSILSQYNPSTGPLTNGVVIDARGFSGTMFCAASPWQGSADTPPVKFSNVVLLPAGTINLGSTLTLPHNTRLVGAGSGLTTLKACKNPPCSSNLSGDMIDMGNSTVCYTSSGHSNCEGVVIEHLTLDASELGLNGIVNQYSQEQGAVNDVTLTSFSSGGTGLSLGTHSDNSGPYTNISYSGSGTCAEIYGGVSSGIGTSTPLLINETRGIHGLTCNMTGGSGPAIYLDAPNNSLEDVYISGSGQDGIRIGSNSAAYNNVLFNVVGSGLGSVIHVSNVASGSGTYSNARDTSILGVSCAGASGGVCPTSTYTIQDDLTSTSLRDANVGMYVLGEPVSGTGGGYSRFTTSTNTSAVTWLVGTSPPSGSCATGSLYSCTNSANCNITSEHYTLWGCIGSGWNPIQ